MRDHIESFLSGLSAIGYSPHSLVKRRAILIALERWVARRHLAVQGLCEQHLEVFLRRRWTHRTHLSCARAVGLRFLAHLRTLGIVRSRPPRQKWAQFGRVLAAFDLYLREERGLAAATRAEYVRHAAKFLHRDPKRRVGRIIAAEVLGHVSEVLRLNSVQSANQASFALKSLLRFLFVSGTLHADLSPAIPRILVARTARLPEVLSSDEVAQRNLVSQKASYRAGNVGNWSVRRYQTSRVVELNGTVTDLTVTQPSAVQTLTVSPFNTLIGWHLTATLDWDASAAELSQLSVRFQNASQYLYNLTDGQFYIEQVEIADDGQLGEAEVAFKVDDNVWPHATWPGGFQGPVGAGKPQVWIAPFSNFRSAEAPSGAGSTDFRTLVHELGHLALQLQDEYMGANLMGNYCTEAFKSSPDPRFLAGGPMAACVMNYQFSSSKLCSGHPDSLHRGFTWQIDSCWNDVFDFYSDPGRTDRWMVRTPDTRGGPVFTLPPLPKDWAPKITLTNNQPSYGGPHPLCAPVFFQDQFGKDGDVVRVVPTYSERIYNAGVLSSAGMPSVRGLLVRGLHSGDRIASGNSSVIVGESNPNLGRLVPCVPTF